MHFRLHPLQMIRYQDCEDELTVHNLVVTVSTYRHCIVYAQSQLFVIKILITNLMVLKSMPPMCDVSNEK